MVEMNCGPELHTQLAASRQTYLHAEVFSVFLNVGTVVYTKKLFYISKFKAESRLVPFF